MKTLKELADLVTVRNHLNDLIQGSRNAVKKGEVAKLSALIFKIDSEFIQESLALFMDETLKSNADEEDISKKIAEAKAQMASKAIKSAAELPQTVLEKAMTAGEPKKEKRKPVIKRVSEDVTE